LTLNYDGSFHNPNSFGCVSLYRCPVCNCALEVFDGGKPIAYRPALDPVSHIP